MAVSAIDTPTQVIISENGKKGETGANGTDGAGFNSVRQSLLNNPLFRGFNLNNLVSISSPTSTESDLNFTRSTVGSRVDFYNVTKDDLADVARLESSGYLAEKTSTNIILYSEDYLNAAWTQAIYNGGANDLWTLTQNTLDIKDIYDTNTAQKLVATATPGDLFARQFGGTFNDATTYAASIYVYVPTQGGITNFDIEANFNDADISSINITEFDKWIRVPNSILTTAARNQINFEIRPNGIAPVSGFTVYSMAAQVEESPQSSYIKTSASSVTRTSDLVNLPTLNNVPPLSSEHTIFMRLNIHDKTQLGRLFSIRVLGASPLDNYTVFFNSTQIVYRINATPSQEIAYTVDAEDIKTLAFVVDSDMTARLYVNGFESGELGNVTPAQIDTAGQMYLFSRDNAVSFQNVNCSLVETFDKALNADEILLKAGE